MSYEDFLPVLNEITNADMARSVPEEAVRAYEGLVPYSLQEIWLRHGTTVLFGDRRLQLCGPAPMQRALAPFACFAPGHILLMGRGSVLYDIHLGFSQLTASPFYAVFGKFSDLVSWLVHCLNIEMHYSPQTKSDVDYHRRGTPEFGPIAIGEKYGCGPPFRVDSAAKNRICKLAVADEIARIHALGPLEHHRIFKDVSEAAKYGGDRFIGPFR